MGSQRERILVVDDEEKILEVLESYLENNGFEVFRAADGGKALQLFNRVNPSLVILDVMLPDLSGEEVCMEIRKQGSKVPIIMLTAKVDEDFKVQCLDYGADDYVTKPFSPKELMGRVRAILRRYKDDRNVLADILNFGSGELVIDDPSHEVRVNGQNISLTPNEYKILLTLCRNPKRVFTREELVVAVFGYDYEGQDRSIDTHVKNLRQKIEVDSKNPKYIITVHGLGYKFGGG
ncbi:MAG: response regulator transcription factor [Clostridia bacterium]|nr:response regulator transcription factor [Clostridia bacterium]